jgi:hypothetical protein
MNPPSRPSSGAAQLTQAIARLVAMSGASTRMTLYSAPQFAQTKRASCGSLIESKIFRFDDTYISGQVWRFI